MDRKQMMDVIKTVCSKYTINQKKLAHKELIKTFGYNWCGARIYDDTELVYSVVNDEKDVENIYYDWWYRTVH